MTKVWVVTLVVLGLSGSAWAKDDFDTYVADLAAAKASTRLATCELLVTPGGQVRQPCSLALVDLVGDAKATLTVKKNKRQNFPKSQMVWREAEVEARAQGKVVATFRVIEVLTLGGPDFPPGVVAAHWARVTSDKEAAALALAKTLPAPASVDKVTPAAKTDADRDQAIQTAQDFLRGGENFKAVIAERVKSRAIAFGSAAGQRYAAASGAKAIQGWKIELAPSGKVAVGGNGWVLAGATTVVATPTDKKAPPITYVLFGAFVSGLTPGGGSFITEPALLSFAIAR